MLLYNILFKFCLIILRKNNYIVLYGNLEIIKITIWRHMETKKLTYDMIDLPYNMNMWDPRS